VPRARRGEFPLLAGLATLFALAVFLYGFTSYEEARRRLDGLVEELGKTVLESAAAGLTNSLQMLDELEREQRTELRLKTRFLTAPAQGRTRDQPPLLQRFALAAHLKHLFLFDAQGRLAASAQEIPPPRGGGVLDPDRVQLAVVQAAWKLAHRGRGELRMEELTLPGAGLKPSLAAAVPLAGGLTAVLVQDAEAFTRVRAAAGPEAVVRRLEAAGRIAYVRFNAPAPSTTPGSLLALEKTLKLPGGREGTLRIGIDRAPVRDALSIQLHGTVLYGLLLVLLATATAWILLRMRHARARLLERARRNERLASLGRLAAGIAHEVRNPLNAIGLAAQRVARIPEASAEIMRLAQVVGEEVARLDRTVEEVLRYARPREPRLREVTGSEILRAVETLALPEAAGQAIRLVVRAREEIRFEADSDLIEGAVWNLVRNAIQASPEGAVVDLALDRSGDWIDIEVRDRGPGVPPEERDRIFEPFHTGRRTGSGLGLSLALSAVESHGGTIEVADAPGGGARFRIHLPVRGATR